MRAAAALLALVLLPAGASAARADDPNVPEANLRAPVFDLDVGQAVLGIDLPPSIMALEEETTSGNKVTVTISADVLFEFGEAGLTSTARKKIQQIAGRLRTAARWAAIPTPSAPTPTTSGSPSSAPTRSRRRWTNTSPART